MKYKLENIPIPSGRLTIYANRDPSRTYAAGFDCAYGLADGDADACVVLDDVGDVAAVLHGRFGNVLFLHHLRPLFDWYEPFIVGERQVGLEVLRQLWDDGRWLYFQRDETKRTRPQRDAVGHHKSATSTSILKLRRALSCRDREGKPKDPAIRVRDAILLDELRSFQFLPKSGATLEGLHDDQMVMGAAPGSHDDLVVALSYALMGQYELPRFEKPQPKYKPGSMGAVLDHEAIWSPPKPHPSSLIKGPTKPT